MDRGEVDGYSTTPFDTLRRVYDKRWKAGKLRILAQAGQSRLPELPDVPTMLELAKSPDDKRLIGLGTVTGRMTFPYMMGPGVPPERVKAMRTAFTSMFADPGFRREAAKRQMMIAPLTADEVVAIVKGAYATPTPIVDRLKDIVARQGN
jgi:tripartite-type tricarboxylate transporter receptor subunit TctC